MKIKKPDYYKEDVYLYGRSSSWGWATWKDRWEKIDWEVKDWESFKQDKNLIKKFNSNGSDMFKMLKSVMESNGNSWAIRFAYAQFKQSKYSIMPFDSLVQNIGFGTEGTNTRFKYSRFKIALSSGVNTEFDFTRNMQIDSKIINQCYAYHAIPIRIFSRLRYILGI